MPRPGAPYIAAPTLEESVFLSPTLVTPLTVRPENTKWSHPQPVKLPAQAAALGKPFDEMSDSDASSSSSPLRGGRRCLCGKQVVDDDGGIYCSIACARTDAFSSLCYKPVSVSSNPHPTLGSSLEPSFARHHASSSTSTSQSTYNERDTLCSTASSSSLTSQQDWSASHYRRLARQDLRREERRDERRRRRAEGSVASSTGSRATHMSSSSTSSSRVPDLIGGSGGGHSRNYSVASTASSSAWSGSQLSRNPSLASVSSLSSRKGLGTVGGGPGGFGGLDGIIMEAEDEEECLLAAPSNGENRTYPVPRKGAHKRRQSHSLRGIGSDEKSSGAAQGDFGLGRDMRDVLEEILQMEKMFMVDEEEHLPPPPSLDRDGAMRAPPPSTRLDPTDLPAFHFPPTGLPPKTPPPRETDKDRMSGIIQAPMAPSRGHKHSLSNANLSPMMGGGIGGGGGFARPPSFIGGHQSSLSESHTALYLATASPVQNSPARRSASPSLEARRSLHFDANSAGPSIAALQAACNANPKMDSPSSVNVTPRRRKINFSPAHHPTMDHWKFPAGAAGAASTPTRPNMLPPINTNLAAPILTAPGPAASRPTAAAGLAPDHEQVNAPASLRSLAPARPVRQNSGSSTRSGGGLSAQMTPTPPSSSETQHVPQHLLWPPPPNLAPSLFPTSPMDTPDYRPATRTRGGRLSPGLLAASPQGFRPPHSGLRLGVLLGSGEDDDDGMDVDDATDAETASGSGHSHSSSTVHGHANVVSSSVSSRSLSAAVSGHSHFPAGTASGRSGFPVFLEAEGFRPAANKQRW